MHKKWHKRSEELSRDIKSNTRKMNENLQQIEKLGKDKASKSKFEVLKGRMDAMSQMEHISYLKCELLPQVNDFADQIKNYELSNEEVKRCIRKFDESISTKANKIELTIMKEELEEKFIDITRWD